MTKRGDAIQTELSLVASAMDAMPSDSPFLSATANMREDLARLRASLLSHSPTPRLVFSMLCLMAGKSMATALRSTSS